MATYDGIGMSAKKVAREIREAKEKGGASADHAEYTDGEQVKLEPPYIS
jgi:hypothetical protein